MGFGQPSGAAAQEMPKGSPSSTAKVCGGSSLKLFSSDLRTKTELVIAVPYLFLAKHWYWPKIQKERGKIGGNKYMYYVEIMVRQLNFLLRKNKKKG